MRKIILSIVQLGVLLFISFASVSAINNNAGDVGDQQFVAFLFTLVTFCFAVVIVEKID